MVSGRSYIGVSARQRSIMSFMIVWYGHHDGRERIQRSPKRLRFPQTRRTRAWKVPSVQRLTVAGALQSLKKIDRFRARATYET